jgi:hypothetical protein
MEGDDVNAPATDPAPSDDPRYALADRLLKLSAWLKGARAGLDQHRVALAAFVQIDNYSAHATNLVLLTEVQERGLDLLLREVARASARLSDEALADALKVAPEIGGGDGAKS